MYFLITALYNVKLDTIVYSTAFVVTQNVSCSIYIRDVHMDQTQTVLIVVFQHLFLVKNERELYCATLSLHRVLVITLSSLKHYYLFWSVADGL